VKRAERKLKTQEIVQRVKKDVSNVEKISANNNQKIHRLNEQINGIENKLNELTELNGTMNGVMNNI
jgi:prefoldin subunit 5